MTDAAPRAGDAILERGLFITFEGGDGSGKSTQASLLYRYLIEQGLTALHTREPGGTDVGHEIRELVLHHRGDIVPRAEALLYAADRAHHVATVVRPALEAGTIVVQDRYLDSSVAYQGVGRELDAVEVRELSLWATQGLLPDLTVLLDIDEADARARLDAANKRFDRLEAQGAEFHARVRTAFLALAEVEKDRFFVVNGAEPAEALATRIAEHVDGLLARHGGAAGAGDVPRDTAAAPAHGTDTRSL
ncbi:dTMP kinase [Humibacter sp. RRB41]|uniref:dTMP kinase n=1 Tax=Humibacter sp. RRB41 TaxID=2919946 RepID=UPI001FAADB47|nr:dTMP kinase [Humibacter sp. RRB41]